MGVGPGTFVICISIIIGIIMCLFKDSIQAPNLMVAAAIALPLIVIGIVKSLPIKPLSTGVT